MVKKERENIQITKIGMREDININLIEIKNIITKYYKNCMPRN